MTCVVVVVVVFFVFFVVFFVLFLFFRSEINNQKEDYFRRKQLENADRPE